MPFRLRHCVGPRHHLCSSLGPGVLDLKERDTCILDHSTSGQTQWTDTAPPPPPHQLCTPPSKGRREGWTPMSMGVL